MKIIRAILVDDEEDSLELLELELEEHCPEVEVLATCTSLKESIKAVRKWKPHLVFLDIRLPDENGFELLNRVKDVAFDVIITTGYEDYAATAFKYGVVDYLMKPIDSHELMKAVRKVKRPFQIQTRRSISAGKTKGKPHAQLENQVKFVQRSEIIYFVFLKDYLKMVLDNGESLLVNLNLKNKEGLLEDKQFMRISKNCIVNKDHIVKKIDDEGSIIMMSNGAILQISEKYQLA